MAGRARDPERVSRRPTTAALDRRRWGAHAETAAAVALVAGLYAWALSDMPWARLAWGAFSLFVVLLVLVVALVHERRSGR